MDRRKVAVVTGASSGLGLAAAKALAAGGWQVIALGRDPARSAAALQEIQAASSGGSVHMIVADLSLMAEAVRAAEEVASHSEYLDVLINNAGGMTTSLVMTTEGYEQNFAGNHLGPFLLTQQLMPLLRRAAAEAPKGRVRVIMTSSDASEMIKGIPWDDLQSGGNFNAGAAYCYGKLANVLFARGLAQRVSAFGIVAHAMHPGVIDSNFINHAGESTRAYMRTLKSQSPADAADTLMWLATAEEPGTSTGGYYQNRKPRAPNPVADDPAYVDRLWSESEALIAKSGVLPVPPRNPSRP